MEDRRPVLLALRALGLGDLLCGFPALRALRDAFPGHRVVLAGPARLAPLAMASGAVDAIVPVGPLQPLPAGMAPPDVAVNLHGRGPRSHRLLLDARPGRLLAFGAPGLIPGPAWRPAEHEVHRWCRMLAWHGVPADPARIELEVAPDPRYAEVAVVHPGAASSARRWPPERFARVVRVLARAGRRVVVTGGPDERALAHRVSDLAGAGNAAVLAGRTGVLDLARIVAAARVVVSGDTGVAHLAAATGTPSLTLFGPVPPSEWGPPSRPRHRVVWTGRRGAPDGALPHAGLLDIDVPRVIRELAELDVVPGVLEEVRG